MENQNPNRLSDYEDASPLSMGSYLIMMIVSAVPVVNLIMLFAWAFGNSNQNRKNFARAQLIVLAACVILFLLFSDSFFEGLGNGGGR